MSFSVVRSNGLTSSQLKVIFNSDIDSNVGINNVNISPTVSSVPSVTVISVSVDSNELTINFRPIFSGAQYLVSFISTSSQDFKSSSGEVVVENGHDNALFIVGPEANSIADDMLEDLPIVYDVEKPSLINELTTSLGAGLQDISDAIDTVKSANYLSITVEDEKMTRGTGPTDKFINGGVYSITRVGDSVSGATKHNILQWNTERYSSFETSSYVIVSNSLKTISSDPISLQAVDVINEEISDNVNLDNYFDGLTIKVSKHPVIQLVAVSLKRGETYIPYDINKFGYTLKDNQYDTENALINVNLTSQQIQLSLTSISESEGSFVTPTAGDKMYVSYIYKKLGRDTSNPSLYSIKQSIRESVPSTITSFYLDYTPIILSNDSEPSTGGVSFLNTVEYDGSSPLTTSHPAFLTEVAFDLSRTPRRPGEFSINYSTGQVLVFGEDADNQGTGANPPLATYYYRKEFVEDLDFTFNSDSDSIALNSSRNIDGIEAKVSFDYEDTFAENTDYRALSHIEVIDERINNRLTSDYTLQTKYYPITDVFRIFNETTGEIYSTTRFSDTHISFSGRKVPEQLEVVREKASFALADQETLFISDELENAYGMRILKIELENDKISDSKQRFIGANFDTSVTFSDTDIFQNEMFYEDRLFTSVDNNIDRLTSIGYYSIDYYNGIIYLAVSEDQDTDLGEISYRYAKIQTKNDHILKANNVYRSQGISYDDTNTYTPTGISDTLVTISGLERVGERFINNTSSRSLIIGTYQSGEDGVTTNGSNLFTSNSALFTSSDVGRALIIGSSTDTPVQQVEISSIINDHQVVVDQNITYTGEDRVWVILDLSSGSSKTITLDYNIVSINDIYLVNQLGTVPFSSLDGYYNINTDSFSGNTITLGASNPLSVGDAVVVNYNPGNIYIDYRYLKDEILVSYEYGENSIDWSISNSLNAGDEYFVSYKYGALREPLLVNFGSLTQIPVLTNFPYNFDRDVYRSIVSGALQSFIKGPTIPAIEELVKSFTDVTPEITEYAFSNWILGRDYLNLQIPQTYATASYNIGKFGNGIDIGTNQYIKVPAISHFRLEEGTWESWVRPSWDGIDNDSTITFDLYKDGYQPVYNVYIGFDATNPSEIPFSISTSNTYAIGQPKNIDEDIGYFIWFNEFTKKWNVRWREANNDSHEFSGDISTTGEIYNLETTSEDGYELNEITDIITSSTTSINFTAEIDGYEPSGDYSTDGISFSSGDTHYLLDMADEEDANRISIFKDGVGYLNFRVIDNGKNVRENAGIYNISKYVGDWSADELHHIATSWKIGTYNNKDELHLFVDGQEVPNLFKYGGNPKASSQYDFGSVGEEIVVSVATRPTVGGYDGVSEADSSLFRSVGIDFENRGVKVGDTLYILEENADGTEDVQGGAYTITGVGGSTVTLDRGLSLTLGAIDFTINPVIATVNTPVNIQKFAVYTSDVNGTLTELNGVNTDEPDYSVSRGSNYTHTLMIRDGVEIADSVIVKTFGLIFRRCKEQVFVYDDNQGEIKANLPYPATLGDIDITSILLSKRLISLSNDEFYLLENGTLFSSFGGDGYDSHFRDGYVYDDGYVCQPSNQDRGRKISVIISGDNINYGVNKGNKIVIKGETYDNAIEETLYFTENGTQTTTEYWTNIESVNIYIVPIDSSEHCGTIEIREYKPINEPENNGDYAEVASYTNGVFAIEIYGSGGLVFDLNNCLYEIDYPTYLKIDIDDMPEYFYIGSDFTGGQNFDGIVDEVRMLNTIYSDLRTGEESSDGTNITSDYNRTKQFEKNNNTTLLLHFDDNLNDSADYVDSFDEGFLVAPSVNSLFGNAMVVSEDRKYEISNASTVFNNDEGTIEFWISPLLEAKEDPNIRYYVDISSSVQEEAESYTKLNVIATQRIKEINSIRLLTDTKNIGTDYFDGGSISNIDGKTITLGTPLPAQNTKVKIDYVPLNSNGDRVSIFKDTSGAINFFVKASGVEHMITTPVSWTRNTWHRVMAMWTTNNSDNNDRLRLFVDGSERGTIRYGTGLIYGTGIIYGQAEIRAGVNRFIVDDINLLDTFSKIYIGTDIYGLKNAMARLDNIRFSDEQRLSSIKTVGNDIIDTNYNGTDSSAVPVVSDVLTTLLINFDKTSQVIDDLITLINSARGIFRFKVGVLDSFNKIGNSTVLKELLTDLINVLKPANSEAIVEFLDD